MQQLISPKKAATVEILIALLVDIKTCLKAHAGGDYDAAQLLK